MRAAFALAGAAFLGVASAGDRVDRTPGGRIALSVRVWPKNAGDNWEILVMAAGGGTTRNVSRHAGDDVAPAWSPDGRRIAFATLSGKRPGIYVVGAEGAGLRRIVPGNGAYAPAWSPDSRRIAFSDPAGISIVRADGSGLRRLTCGPATPLRRGRPTAAASRSSGSATCTPTSPS